MIVISNENSEYFSPENRFGTVVDMVSDEPVKILFIDDEPGMLSAIRDYLQMVHHFVVDISDSPSDALYNLDIFAYDCLIVDYEMPEMDGITLLKEIRSINPDIPIIVFTGKSREDVVIEALNEGADFYLQKGRNADELFTEMSHDIMRCARRYRAEKALVESEERYRALIEDQTEFICRMDTNGIITYINLAYCLYLEQSPEELLGESFYDLYPGQRDTLLDAVESCDPDHPVSMIELSLFSSLKPVRWQEWSIRVLFNHEFEIGEILAVGRDISEKREIERQMNIQRDLGLSLAMSASIESVLDLSLAAACEISGMKTGIVYLRDRSSGVIRETFSKGTFLHSLRGFIDIFENEQKYLAMTTGTAQFLSMTDMREYDAPFLSVALIPVQRYEETVGWFILASDDLIEVPTICRDALISIASQIGNVITRIEAEEALRDALLESEERYMQLSETSPDAIAILVGKRPVYLNPAALNLFEAGNFHEFNDRPFQSYLDPFLADRFETFIHGLTNGQPPSVGEGWFISREGRKIFGEIVAVPISHGGDSATLLIIKDKTSELEQELALKESERRFREMADLLPEPVFEADSNGILTFCNRSVLTMGHTKEAVQPGDWVYDLVTGSDQNRFSVLIDEVVTKRLPKFCDCANEGPEGETWYYHISLAPIIQDEVCTGVRGVLLDISDIRRYQESLQRIIDEKDVLFREIHHRVKNNMQIISSLLQLQEEYLDDPRVIGALQDCGHRINSLALVHETLYQTDSLAEIPFEVYLSNLVDAVISGYATNSDIRTEINIGDITLSLDTAVTLGLILNELMVNSMKYAFHGRSTGLISLNFQHKEGSYMLEYSDNGIGLPEGFDVETSGSLGMRLIRILVKQIHGNVAIKSTPGDGFRCTLQFSN